MSIAKIQTRHQWIAEIAALSPVIAGLAVQNRVTNDAYLVNGVVANDLAFNLGNSVEHNAALARCFEGLHAAGVLPTTLEKYVTDLTGRTTYGAFCELAAYLWLLDLGLPFDIQAPMTGAQILNPNGSDLDGRLTIASNVYFDVKGFGFHEYLIDRLRRRLIADFPNDFVAIEGSWDVPITTLDDLLSGSYAALKADLAKSKHARRGILDVALRPKAQVQTTARTVNAYRLARENAEYAFRFAKQFVRAEPFVLIFVVHPWLNGSLHQNFARYADTFTRAFARRTFMQFRADATPVMGVPRPTAAGLLSGVAFLNVWRGPPKPEDDSGRMRLYLNPYALNPVSDLTRDHLVDGVGRQLVSIDDFRDDTY